jgi:hypothetical protein
MLQQNTPAINAHKLKLREGMMLLSSAEHLKDEPPQPTCHALGAFQCSQKHLMRIEATTIAPLVLNHPRIEL